MEKVDKAIVDTNVLQYGVNVDYSVQVADLFEIVSRRKLGLVISGYTAFEIYRGISKKKIPVTRSLVDSITKLNVDLITFKIAAVLHNCYEFHEATSNKKFGDAGDIIIAANSIRYNAAIVTANGNDFPRPFFSEVENFQIVKGPKGATITIHLLKPEIAIFNEIMHQCFDR